MKKVIRLTESDLTRIVRRVIREQEWSDDDEMEYQNIRKGSPYLKDFDNDVDLFRPELEKWQNDPRHIELKNKKQASIRKKEEERYSNVVKNRPSDYDRDIYQSEYDDLNSGFEKWRNNAPKWDETMDNDEWLSKFEKYKNDFDHENKSKRKSYLSKHLDRDNKRK
jgi:hypothetical protein